MKTSISSKGQIVLPVEYRRQDRIRAGQEFEIERIRRGEYRLKLRKKQPNEGLLEHLLACPVKDWLEPPEGAETTDDAHVPRLG